jgi:hypothetical protein
MQGRFANALIGVIIIKPKLFSEKVTLAFRSAGQS